MTVIEAIFSYVATHPVIVPFLGGIFGGEEAIVLLARLSKQGILPFWSAFIFFTIGVVFIFLFKHSGKVKKFWTKGLHPDEIIDKSRCFYYNLMLTMSIGLIQKINKKLKKSYKKITCPCLVLYSKYELVADWRAIRKNRIWSFRWGDIFG